MVQERSERGNTHPGLKTFIEQRRRTIQPAPNLEKNIIKESLMESGAGTTTGGRWGKSEEFF